jgi:hypothetical protein
MIVARVLGGSLLYSPLLEYQNQYYARQQEDFVSRLMSDDF